MDRGYGCYAMARVGVYGDQDHRFLHIGCAVARPLFWCGSLGCFAPLQSILKHHILLVYEQQKCHSEHFDSFECLIITASFSGWVDPKKQFSSHHCEASHFASQSVDLISSNARKCFHRCSSAANKTEYISASEIVVIGAWPVLLLFFPKSRLNLIRLVWGICEIIMSVIPKHPLTIHFFLVIVPQHFFSTTNLKIPTSKPS